MNHDVKVQLDAGRIQLTEEGDYLKFSVPLRILQYITLPSHKPQLQLNVTSGDSFTQIAHQYQSLFVAPVLKQEPQVLQQQPPTQQPEKATERKQQNKSPPQKNHSNPFFNTKPFPSNTPLPSVPSFQPTSKSPNIFEKPVQLAQKHSTQSHPFSSNTSPSNPFSALSSAATSSSIFGVHQQQPSQTTRRRQNRNVS